MQATKWVLGLGMTAGALLTAVEANAVYVPPAGSSTFFKLSDATSFYDSVPEGTGTGTPAPRGTTPTIGDQDFTAFRITSIDEGNGDFTPTSSLMGIVTFLEYETSFIPNNDAGGNPDPSLGGVAFLGDSSRTHTVAVDTAQGRTTIGRFFLFEVPTNVPTSPDEYFNIDGVSEADDVVFNDFQFGYNIDSLGNIVTPTSTLLATGSIRDTFGADDGLIPQFFTPSGLGGGVDLESIISGQLVIDGGVWFANDITEGTFSIHLYTIEAGATADDIEGGLIREDVFEGEWLASSEDPVVVERPLEEGVIPEPVTAGLGTLAMASLAAYATRRRRA